MPEIGEIKRGSEIGFSSGYNKFIWHACVNCGKERWVGLKNGVALSSKCRGHSRWKALGKENPNWKGGIRKAHNGYILVWISPDDFFHSMADENNCVPEHRLVMAKSIGRCLQSWEKVHHKGIRYTGIENKSDNLIDNLELTCSIGEHSLNHSKGYRDGYQKGYQEGKRLALLRRLNSTG